MRSTCIAWIICSCRPKHVATVYILTTLKPLLKIHCDVTIAQAKAIPQPQATYSSNAIATHCHISVACLFTTLVCMDKAYIHTYIRIWFSAVQFVSVGLTQACPNYAMVTTHAVRNFVHSDDICDIQQ